MSVSKGATQKGYIYNCSTKEKMSFQFNPTTFEYGRSATYTVLSSPGMNYPKYQYVKGEEITFSVELFMFCKGEKGNIINENIKFIKALLPKEKNEKTFKKPPQIIYCLGKYTKRCHVTKYKVHIEEWDTKGNPVNATISLDITQEGAK